MNQKIYEYKDALNWFLAEWGDRSDYNEYSEVSSEASELVDLVESLVGDTDLGFPLNVTVVRYASSLQFLTFLFQIVEETLGRKIEIVQRQGALLIVEGEQLLSVYLPKNGLPLADFLGREGLKDRLLIATRNEGKTKEFRQIFEQMGFEVENLNDYPDLPEVAETGMTFEENARLKAETISQLTGKMVLADDSGLMVDILGGLPGVWSARFAGVGATDLENNAKLLHELAMVFELKDRSAKFHTTLVVASPGKESLVVEADWPGYINFEPKGENGFGYDPLFLVGETGKTSAQLTLEEKNQQSHRALAVKKLVEVFPPWQNMSDSHGDRQIVEEIKNHYKGKVDAIFHNGDSELESTDPVWEGIHVVKGNMDFYGEYPERLVTQLGPTRIIQTHGHLFQINFSFQKLDLWAQEEDADICLYGHLHIPDAWKEGRTLFLNPGSVSLPRGPIQECLYAKVEIDADSYRVEFLNRKHEVYEPLTKEFDR